MKKRIEWSDWSDEPLEHLRQINDRYSSTIPTEVIHSNSPDRHYKVRGNWWLGVKFDLEYAIESGKIPESKLPLVREVIAKYHEVWTQRPPDLYDPLDNTLVTRVTPEDINFVETRIRRILGQD